MFLNLKHFTVPLTIRTIGVKKDEYLSIDGLFHVFCFSHLLSIPPGPVLLSDVILSSSLMGDVASLSAFEFGVDPELDPELALALRMSLEEEQARQRPPPSHSAITTQQPPAPSVESSQSAAIKEEDAEMTMDEEDDMAKAIALSLEEQVLFSYVTVRLAILA